MTVARRIAGLCRQCAEGVVELVLPGVCVACGRGEAAAAGLCLACNMRLLELVCLPYCRLCGSTLPPNVPAREDGCAQCPTVLPRFAQVVRLGPYAAPLRQVVRQLKYRGQDQLRRRLGSLLAQAVAGSCGRDAFDLVLPVPMHWRRRLGRGCDLARLLGRRVAGQLHLPLGRELVRVRNTPPQVHLSRTGRIENVRGAFGVRGRSALAGAKVLLVDDVTTTGATASEAARTLLGAGAYSVVLAVIGKSEPPTAYAGRGQMRLFGAGEPG